MILNDSGILKEYDLVTWPVNLVVAIGNIEEEINNLYVPSDTKYNYIGGPNYKGGTTYNVTNKETGAECCLIWFIKKENCVGSLISHEAGHVALEIFKYTNSIVDFENQEPFCYLLGNIARLVIGTVYELPGIEPPQFKKTKKKK